MTLTSNPQLELAHDFIQNTNRNIFLTGKAGTGKTTFLHQIQKENLKRLAVVAPTGVAAINARGMTIHSLFQLPFGPYIPGSTKDLSRQRKFSAKKIELIKSLDLLIIDEISMVRADVLDAIDAVLRRYKDYRKPFGGLQLLMIGDLHQLPPVVRDEDWYLLREHYKTPYFFGSLALQKTKPITIELKHIYRQSDEIFIRLLNKVRNNQMDSEVLQTLNSRYIPNFQPTKEEGYITLTSHNATAQSINKEKLDLLSEVAHTFTAQIEEKFPEHAYPTDKMLVLKEGSQVLFIKNDASVEKRYYNGKIGQIVSISDKIIRVKCPDDYEPIDVSPVEWSNVKYTLDAASKEVKEEVIGTFTQYPLKLAWAITIHKSQGLTFERAIIDAQSAFAHGQVYVALSRCKSFEGIVLRSKIGFTSVKTDTVVKDYSEEADKNAPDAAELHQSKRTYQQSLIQELFSFKDLEKLFYAVSRTYMEHENSLSTEALNQWMEIVKKAESHLFSISQKFQPQLRKYFGQTELPEANEDLQARIQKALLYFSDLLSKSFLPALKKIPVVTDNQEIKKKAVTNLKNLEKALYIKNACFVASKNAFSVHKYIKAKANADINFEHSKQSGGNSYKKTLKSPHPILYRHLLDWRDNLAADYDMNPYDILGVKSIHELVKYLPTGTNELKRIKGIGASKIKKFGADIIGIIEKYCTDKNIPSNLLTAAPALSKKPPKPKRPNTKVITYDLYKAGKTIEEIAKERSLTTSSIEGHLSHFIGLGELDVFELVERSRVEEMANYFKTQGKTSFTEAKVHFNNKYDYGEMRMVVNYLKSQTMVE